MYLIFSISTNITNGDKFHFDKVFLNLLVVMVFPKKLSMCDELVKINLRYNNQEMN